ncbi:S1 family peptidase [Streptomyces sp. A7024]|uniref:S1 family peptidase n=1 Tax=Streptomyces coryli TaxID=1128680 RepID=A0A6G4TSZ2_9ACTN|nr:carbohydrate-binding protein [Streptomyces coryli]NGN63105.1 S1 family peptidase [Streptomyces coryli]
MLRLLRRRRTLTATLAAAAALTLAGLPQSASAAPDTAAVSTTSPEVLRAMQRDLNLSADQAEDRLANEARAGATAGRLQLALGKDFAGAWVSGTDARLTVATTDRADVAAIEARGAHAQVVDHSLRALEATQTKLNRAAARARTADSPVWYVDTRANAVTVRALRASAAQEFIRAAGADPAAIRVVRTEQRPRALYDIRGGDAYYMNNTGRCSVGFAITRGTTNGFATAGHCGRPGTTTTGYNRVAQGSFQASVFPGQDMAWVATNTNWRSTPTVNGSAQQVAGSTQAPVGSSVCRSGSTTGWHCGTIQQHNTSVTYPEGTINGVTRTTVCAEPGDSGGSYISGSQAQGVTSGGSGNCSSGGTTFYQPINPILSAYGLTLTTSGSGPGDPGPGEPGTWSAGTVYKVGDTVTHGGASYRCLQGHQAQPGWEPPNTPALWQRV